MTTSPRLSRAELRAAFAHLDPDIVDSAFDECRGSKRKAQALFVEWGVMSRQNTSSDGMEAAGTVVTEDYEEHERQSSDLYNHAIIEDHAEKRKAELEVATNQLFKTKMDDIAMLVAGDRAFDARAKAQKALGPQSNRGRGNCGALQAPFNTAIEREAEHCGEFVVVYHCYNGAHILYEVQSVIAQVVYGLPQLFAPLPRIRKGPFLGRPHVRTLVEEFSKFSGQDHDPNFRAVAISTSVGLHGSGSEAPPTSSFQMGYGCTDLSFTEITASLLESLGASRSSALDMVKQIATTAASHNIAYSNLYDPSASGANNGTAGHMLQIFIRADCVDDVAYGSEAFGVYNANYNPLSRYLMRDKEPSGQARVFWHPTLFNDPTKVKIYHYAADPKNTPAKRLEFHAALRRVLKPLLGTPEGVIRAFKALEGLV